jgi:metal-dependent amidase/aminoacylase/carboxypeptidase family protein
MGVFDDVAMAMTVHPTPRETCAAPSLAPNELEVRYTSKESHAAGARGRGVNAGDALTVDQVTIGLTRQYLDAGQMVHGIVSLGGATPNIVPADLRASYYLRAPDVESLQRPESRIRDCFMAGAIASGCEHAAVQVSPVYDELRLDKWLAAANQAAIMSLGRTPEAPRSERNRTLGSTDMGNITYALPAIHPTIAIDCGVAVNHQHGFTSARVTASADRAVLDGALAMAWTAVAAAIDDEQRGRLISAVTARSSQAVAGGAA